MTWKFWEGWKFWESGTGHADLRLALYGGAKQFLIILAIGLVIKAFVFDSLKVEGAQMEPAVMAGDRILLFKTPYAIPLIKNLSARRGKPVVAALADRDAFTILRVAAISGDTVGIDAGQLYRNGIAVNKFFKDTETLGVIPADYSPSDFMNTMRVPTPGDSIDFRTLTMRDFVFAYSVFRQETPNAKLKAHILVGDSIINDYDIRDFALYKGRLDSIPEASQGDWFFWDKMQSFFNMTAEGQKPQLAFSVWRGGKEIHGFRVKSSYVFLLGDNWNGARDSRHFGPLQRANVKGRPLITLWGYEEKNDGKLKFSGKRIARFIK